MQSFSGLIEFDAKAKKGPVKPLLKRQQDALPRTKLTLFRSPVNSRGAVVFLPPLTPKGEIHDSSNLL